VGLLSACSGDVVAHDRSTAGSAGCDSSPPSIAENTSFTAYDADRDHANHTVAATEVDTAALRAAGLPTQLGGLTVSGMYVDNGTTFFYYSETDAVGTPVEQLVDEGALAVGINRVHQDASIFDMLSDSIGDRVRPVRIGPYDGSLVWSDPDRAGVRRHHLDWGDKTFTMTIMAVRDPSELVRLGRSLVCWPPPSRVTGARFRADTGRMFTKSPDPAVIGP